MGEECERRVKLRTCDRARVSAAAPKDLTDPFLHAESGEGRVKERRLTFSATNSTLPGTNRSMANRGWQIRTRICTNEDGLE